MASSMRACQPPAVLLLLLVMAMPPAWAERSRLDDEAEVVERGDCEISWALQRERERSPARRRESRALELGCGIGWGSELALALQRQRSREGDKDEAADLELKTTLIPREGAGFGLSLIAAARRERVPQLPARWAEMGLALEAAQQPAAGWRLQARVGTQRDRSARRDSTAWELASEHALAERWELRAQLAGEDRPGLQWALSLRWQVWPEDLSLSLTHGASTAGGRARIWALVLNWEL